MINNSLPKKKRVRRGTAGKAKKAVKIQMMRVIRNYAADRQLNQQEAAELLKMTQPRFSCINTLKDTQFSVDSLIDVLSEIGIGVKVEIVNKDSTRQ